MAPLHELEAFGQLVARNSYTVTPYRSLPSVYSPISVVDVRLVGRANNIGHFSGYVRHCLIDLSLEKWSMSLIMFGRKATRSKWKSCDSTTPATPSCCANWPGGWSTRLHTASEQGRIKFGNREKKVCGGGIWTVYSAASLTLFAGFSQIFELWYHSRLEQSVTCVGNLKMGICILILIMITDFDPLMSFLCLWTPV